MGNCSFTILSIAAGAVVALAGSSLQAQTPASRPRVSPPCDSCGVVTGRVTNRDEKPIIGATVRIMGTKQGSYSRAPEGRFRVEGIRAGDYEIIVSAVGFAPQNFEVEIRVKDSVELLVELERGELPTNELLLCRVGHDGIIRDRAATIRSLSGTDISARPRASLHEAVGTMGSIRWFDPDGGGR